MIYPVFIELGDDTHAFGVVVPDLPGCFSAGDTLDEAMDNAREAMCLWLEGCIDDGQPVPQPSDPNTAIQNPDYKGWCFAMIEVDLSKISGKTKRINITLPRRALWRLDLLAKKSGKSRSGYLAELIYAAS